MRPPVKRISGRYWVTVGVVPISGKKIRLPSPRRRPSTGTSVSGTTMGSPPEPLRIPGSSRTAAASSLEMSLCHTRAPDVIRTTRSARTLPISCRRAPVPMASMETSTPTAQVTPMMMVNTDAMRSRTPDRFTSSMARDCRATLMLPSAHCQRRGDLQPCGHESRDRRADQSDQRGTNQADPDHDRGHRQTGYEPRGKREYQQGRRQSACAGCDEDHHRLREHEDEHRAVGKPEGLQNRKLGRALPNRLHGHGG